MGKMLIGPVSITSWPMLMLAPMHQDLNNTVVNSLRNGRNNYWNKVLSFEVMRGFAELSRGLVRG